MDKFFAWVRRIFDNDKPVIVAIVVFVILLIWLLATPARAEQTLSLEAGSAMLRGETPTLGFNWACRECGAVRTDWEAGFELIGKSSHFRDNSNVIQVHAQVVDGWKRAELGLGFAYFNVAQEYTCQFTFHLMARYRLTERMALQWRHSSSAGSCTPNAGRDLLTFSVRMGTRS